MAMIKCGECGAQISNKAQACPQCGAKRPKRTNRLTLIFAWLLGAGGLMAAYSAIDSQQRLDTAAAQAAAREAALPPEQRAALARDRAAAASSAAALEIEFQRAVSIARQIKANMKDPDSFKLTGVTLTSAGALCFQYRAKNSFNAVVQGFAVVPKQGPSAAGSEQDVAGPWNKHCAGKSGSDFTHVRQVL